MEWKFDDGRPIYAQLVEQMEQAVVTGVYAAGQKLPGVREIAAEAGVNPNTMQRALAELEATGLLFTQRTAGRFVTEDEKMISEKRNSMAAQESGRYIEAMRALGCSEEEIKKLVDEAIKKQE